jgi:hypothetical protein
MSDDELEEVLYWVGREIQEARRALWDGKSGKAFASIEAAEEEFEKLEEMIEAADNGEQSDNNE